MPDVMPSGTPSGGRFLLPKALPLLLFAGLWLSAYIAAFYPGAMGFDAAYQWWQARGGETTNIHGIAMTWLWRLTSPVSHGPGALFVLQLLTLWAGIVLIAVRLPVRSPWRGVFMFAATCAPVCFVLFSMMLSDTLFMAVMCCVAAATLCAMHAPRAWRIVLILLLLQLGLLLRKNALPAAFPFVIWMAFPARSVAPGKLRKFVHGTAIAVALLAAMQAGAWLLERNVDRRVSVLPATTLWDLAAISLDTHQILLPAGSHGPGLTLDDLRQAFVPYANTTLFAKTRAGMRQPFLDSDDPLNAQIRRAWLDAIRRHPRAYLAHRWRLSSALFGEKQADWPHELVYLDGEYRYDANPRVEPNHSAAHRWLIRLFARLRTTLLLAAWPYVVLALVAVGIGWRRRHHAQARVALAVLASGLFYALPLPFIAPSAELRYLGWTCLSAILGGTLAFTSPSVLPPARQRPSREAERQIDADAAASGRPSARVPGMSTQE